MVKDNQLSVDAVSAQNLDVSDSDSRKSKQPNSASSLVNDQLVDILTNSPADLFLIEKARPDGSIATNLTVGLDPKAKRPKVLKQFTQTDYIDPDPSQGIFSFIEARAKRQPDDVLFNYKVGPNRWNKITGQEFAELTKRVAKGLLAKGLKPGDAIAIMGHTSIEWITMDYAAALLGLISVPIYETSSERQMVFILQNADVKMAFVETKELFNKFEEIRQEAPKFQGTLIFEEQAIAELEELGQSISDADLSKIAAQVNGETIYTIVYTSGSTGSPKGVELTHHALMTIAVNVQVGVPRLLMKKGSVFLLFLPMAHILARFACLTIAYGVAEIGVIGDISSLLDDLRYLKPHWTIAVPRVCEKIINAASHKAGYGIKGRIFQGAVKTAVEYSQALDSEAGVSRGLELRRALYDRLVYHAIRDVLGGRMEYLVCGGAPLSVKLSHFFRGAGVTILEGYGLTETCGVTFVSRPEANAIGSLGYPVAGVEYKLAKNGELLLKCGSLLSRYHKDEAATQEVLHDGWFHTGDLAQDNGDGTITLTGRSKELIVTAGGKNISPGTLEGALKENTLISQVVLVGDRKPYISALITLDPETFALWKVKVGLVNLQLENAPKDLVVKSEVQRMVDKANLLVSRAESIRRFIILPEDFSEENGLLTSSMKLKRQAVYERYQDLIDSEIYSR
ncbi:MAG: AMP-dependent synthetase/ligase [Bifidobacteriaceae bacterium]|jgi:long-chain acyl-CoA synthetase|nr:AMP-dependent synthetase/ligase [Bifidobacteriaceae bacterium]